MTASQIRQKYLDFFKEKGHAILPSASLVPENDPTTLFTGSGMQPMVPYLLGEAHPQGTRVADAQKCFRAQDIEEIGDNRHTTAFEMLGNWSFGDYFKEEQITWIYTFLTKEVGLDPKHLYVTVFRGNDALGLARDTEAVDLWKKMFAGDGVPANDVDFSERDGMQNGRIFYYDETKNWWSRNGEPEKMPLGEPGGTDTEIFWDFGEQHGLHNASPFHDKPCHVNCDCGRFMEIGNNVFMTHRKTETGFEPLAKRNVDFGGGLERITAASINNPDMFQIDVLKDLIATIESASGKKYQSETRAFRIIADHVRAATFIIGDPKGMAPSNVGQGYVVRRLLRRAVREGRRLGITGTFLATIAEKVIAQYGDLYTEFKENRNKIVNEITKEEEKFAKTIEKGMKEFEKMRRGESLRKLVAGGAPGPTFTRDESPLDPTSIREVSSPITGEQAFMLFSTYGFPLELTEEMLREQGQPVDREAFEAEFKKHQDLSRTASAGAFKGGLADHSAETTRLHTATHLLHKALKTVLGDHVEQKGSNITAERLRFDFSHPEKMTPEQLKQVEDMVNGAIQKDYPVTFDVMSLDDAKASGALGYFEDKYAQMDGKIKVYTVGDDTKGVYSREICGGPHVDHTGVLGSFKITKEESVSAGVRRIKATVSGN